MSTINDGGPAYPVPGLQHDESFNGMSLRNYFATHAITGVCQMICTGNHQPDPGERSGAAFIARSCLEIADELIRQGGQS